jgi:UDP-N-acetylglucosamine--N-acetylmuramyl-(pentapeptide) pyrophosphoryl-undecaprenol N-acetylglucosamine transferase
MKSKKKFLIATGGTGGHVFPAYSLAKYFIKKNIQVQIISDVRGYQYLKNYEDIKIKTINTTTIYKKNIFASCVSFLKILIAIIQSYFFLRKSKPNVIFGMGGYASFPICLAAKLLGIQFILYENNLHIGKANKYLLPFSNKIFVSYSSLEGISKKYSSKVLETGNIIRQEILEHKYTKNDNLEKKISILILGGSQAAKSFAEKLPNIFKQCKQNGIHLRLFQQCLESQNSYLKEEYSNLNIENEIFNFSYNLLNYFEKVDLVITRSGASMLAEILNCKIPLISIPLPSSAENHQFKNAKYFENKGYGFLINENELDVKLFPLIKSIHKDKSLLTQMKNKQNNHTDILVFKKIESYLEEFIHD